MRRRVSGFFSLLTGGILITGGDPTLPTRLAVGSGFGKTPCGGIAVVQI